MTTYIYAEEGGHEETLEAATVEAACEEARRLLYSGDWSIGQEETGRSIYPEARILIDTADGDREEIERVSVRIDPDEPDCVHDDGHDWKSPLEVVGGIEENPGCWGHGGGVITRECCRHCGAYRVTDTWDQSQGPEPVETLRYEAADDDSRAWVESQTYEIEVAVDQDQAEPFVAWLNDQGHDASVGQSTGAYVDSYPVSGNRWADGVLDRLWHRYCDQ